MEKIFHQELLKDATSALTGSLTHIIKLSLQTGVLYIINSSFTTIENKLNAELKTLAQYFTENGLLINLKIGRIESTLFGTAKRLEKYPGKLELYYHNTKINSTTTYKIFKSTSNSKLNMRDIFRVATRKYLQS